MKANWAAREQIVRLLEREHFRKFDCCIFPSLTDGQETNAQRESGRDHSNPFVRQPSRETDARLRKHSTSGKRKIFAALKKVGVLAAKSQHSLGQKHFDPAVRPRTH
jgi:hypothetical protein